MSWAILFLLMSRLPLYIYVINKAWKYRNSIILISANWLGVMTIAAASGALANTFAHSKLISNLFGLVFAFSLFMVGYTARELKRKED